MAMFIGHVLHLCGVNKIIKQTVVVISKHVTNFFFYSGEHEHNNHRVIDLHIRRELTSSYSSISSKSMEFFLEWPLPAIMLGASVALQTPGTKIVNLMFSSDVFFLKEKNPHMS